MSWTALCLCPLLALAVSGSLRAQTTIGLTDNVQSAAIQVYPIPDDADEVLGFSEMAAGRKAYLVIVPPGANVEVALEHPRKAVLALTMATLAEWTGRRKSNWQDRATLNAKQYFANKGSAPEEVYFLVTDPRQVSNPKEPYRVKITRSWKAPVAK